MVIPVPPHSPAPVTDLQPVFDAVNDLFDQVTCALQDNLDLNSLPIFADAPPTGGANTLVTMMIMDLNNTRASILTQLSNPTFLLNLALATTDEARAAALRGALANVTEITVTPDDPVNPTDIVDFVISDTFARQRDGRGACT